MLSLLERSYNCICNPYLWRIGAMGHSSGIHPRWWVEKGREVNRSWWVEKLGKPSLSCWVLASYWDQTWKKEKHHPSCTFSELLFHWFLSFYVIQAHGILPLIILFQQFPYGIQVYKIINHFYNYSVIVDTRIFLIIWVYLYSGGAP